MDVGVEGLRVLAGGTIPPNPAELLASPATRSILNELASSSDVVVVDTAPILPVADTLELVTPQSLVLIVARKGVSRFIRCQPPWDGYAKWVVMWPEAYSRRRSA
jgi:Mrp family chromosome partitioning ATPase